jgi:ubiquitin C-terminal hydrolase
LNDLLDALHEDSNKVVNKPYVEALEDGWVESRDLSKVGEESWRR